MEKRSGERSCKGEAKRSIAEEMNCTGEPCGGKEEIMGINIVGEISVADLFKIFDFVRECELELYLLKSDKSITVDGIKYIKGNDKLVIEVIK